ncbi:hypothetical protein BOTBODRAFT_39877 [Botryobasidium botryosum FD-172 SS1]|uniref:Prephenate dehydratase domain-containing protein n=1 Tax=Botryobasidium botryosum (strain FD-172 SS1) TaxID=930990 RepID=A0A067LUK9_BOTB1|nr:hypothetical protein BOTBODRAFT_39877 [Botryobasidium botryosum FD-172 SS1]
MVALGTGDSSGRNSPQPLVKFPITAAFLGPEGTYTHQAAYELFGEGAKYVAKNTISETYKSVSTASSPTFCVIPAENSIFGTVTETYDLLRGPEVGVETFIRGECQIGVRHCLVVRRGVKLEDITKIASHEQALGQCSQFISTHLPHATLSRATSTAAAARSLLEDQGDGWKQRAAICSRICIKLYAGLEIIWEGIQNSQNNYTRFFVLSAKGVTLPSPPPESPLGKLQRRALLRIALPATAAVTSTGTEPPITLSTVLPALLHPALFVNRIDRRPSLLCQPFHDYVYIELQAVATEKEDTGAGWAKALESVMAGVKVAVGTGEVVRLGTW